MSEALSSRTLSAVRVVSSTPCPTLGRFTSTFTAVSRPTNVYPSGGSMARTEGRWPASGTPESTPESPPPSGHAVRNPQGGPPSGRSPPSVPPPLTPLLHADDPIRAVIAAAAAHRPALLMVCRRPSRPRAGVAADQAPRVKVLRKVGLPDGPGKPSSAQVCSPVRGHTRPRGD